MARWWRHLLITTASLAAVAPVQVQFDLRSGADLQLMPSAAMAEAGGGAGNGGGHGNGGGNGNGNGNAGDNSGAGAGAGNGNGNGGGNGSGAAGGNSENGNSGNGNAGGKGGANGSGGSPPGGNGAGQGMGGGPTSGDNPGGVGAGGWGDGSGRSGKAPGRSRNASDGANRGGSVARGHGSWFGQDVLPVRSGTARSAKPAPTDRGVEARKPDKASVASRKGQSSKGTANRANGKMARGRSDPTKSARAGKSPQSPWAANPVSGRITDSTAPIGSQFKPRKASNSIIASGLSNPDLTKLAALGLQLTSQTKGHIAPQAVRLLLPSGMSLTEALRTVKRISREASADMDTYYYTDGEASECSDPGCQASSLVGWTPPETDDCGPPALIGLVDTGIDLDHEALRDRSIELLNIPKESGSSSSLDHGTAIAALLVGRPDSVAPGLTPRARLLAVDAFFKSGGTADRADVLSLVGALEALAARGVKVINLSLSGPPNEILRRAVEVAQAKGIVLVAAAGNNGAAAEPSYPAAYPGVIAVTAVDRQLNVYRRATQGSFVAFAAPGVEIRTAQSKGGSATRSGTSYAVPFVSAAIAMMQAAHPETNLGDLQKQVQDNTRDLGPPGRDATFGYGLLQMTNLCSAPEGQAIVPMASKAPSASPVQQHTIKGP